MRKNNKSELETTALPDGGLGIRELDGFIWFVRGAFPGGIAPYLAMKLKKNYGFAHVETFLKPSPERVTPRYAVEQRCGGCQLQTLSYEAELRFEVNKVREDPLHIGEVSAERLDVVTEAIVWMEEPSRYRNKIQAPFATGKDGRPVVSLYTTRSHRMTPWFGRGIGAKESAHILEVLLAFTKRFGIAPYDEESGRGLPRHALIRKSRATKSYMLCLIVSGKEPPHWEMLFQTLQIADSEDARLETLVLNTNARCDNVILGDTARTPYGRGYIENSVGGIRFRISPYFFYQMNPAQTEAVYGAVLEFAVLGGNETAWGLYYGIGTISLFLAWQARKVYGVEIMPAATRDTKENAKRNGITNAELFTGTAEEVLLAWQREHPVQYVDVITVDSPRKGCDKTVLRIMVELALKRIVYVSCNLSTLARDTKYLRTNGYELTCARPADNFPRTMHVETVCLTSKVEEKQSRRPKYTAVFG